MDAYTGVEGFYGNVTVTAKGDDAKWVGPNSRSVPSTYTTTSPVEISWLDIGAPDGASVTRFQPSGDSHLGATMTPANGLLTVENGQRVIRYTTRTQTIDYAQQQEITLTQDFFPANIVADAGPHSTTEYKTNFTVPTTGQYNFYISRFGAGDIKIGNYSAQWSSRSDPTKLTTQLTAGSSNSFVLNYDHSGYGEPSHF